MSSNQLKSSMDDEGEEKPGTSASFLDRSEEGDARPRPTRRRSSSQGNVASEEEQEPKNISVKARNISRDRPDPETPESKRLKVSEDDESSEGDEIPEAAVEGMAMDTDSSDDGDSLNPDESLAEGERNSGVEEPDSVPGGHIQSFESPEAARIRSRRSSTADENVSTTMQPSSRTYSSFFSPAERRDSSSFVLDQAVASSSAAAMAPPLSRIMEESPALSEVRRQSTSAVYAPPEDLRRVEGLRRSTERQGPSAGTATANITENVDVNENRGPEQFLDKLHGKQRLMWARKLFFVSTELVFPGFTAYSDNKGRMADYLGVRVRSSCVMQALLYADSLFFIMWILSFLNTCDILVTVLKQLHGYLSICLTILFIIVNAIRLRFGLKGNENDEVQYLALFWMTTVIVQIPLFTFIFLTDLFCPVLMAFTVTMDGAMMIFILLESVVGFIHFRSLLRDELNIIKMAKRSKEVRASPHQRQENQTAMGAAPVLDSRNVHNNDNESESSNTDSEIENDRHRRRMQEGSMDFRMQIRRLSEARRERNENEHQQDDSASDSSEQVTSTSDAIRQRPIRAH